MVAVLPQKDKLAMVETVEQIDPTSELPIDVIKKRATTGAVFLTLRTILIQVISFTATILLTLYLSPSQFGVYFLVSAVISFLAYFSDVGFAAALIQKKEQLSNEELKTIFTIQQVLVTVIITVVFVATPIIRNIYKLNDSAVFLLWALSISLIFSSLKTIPSVLLERRLEFNKLVIPQIVEALLFNIIAVLLAWKGFGVASFTVAVLVRGFVGLVIMYVLQPWIPGIAFSKPAVKSLMKFGIPYQMNTFLAMVKDDGMTLFLGGALGTSGIGLLGWAQKWAFAPLRFFMDQVIKVTFPAFSRLQDNEKELSNGLSKSIMFVCVLVFPSLLILILIAPTLTQIIPKYQKWTPALLALSLLCVNSALAAITTPVTNALNATGRISITFKLMIMWTVLTWLVIPGLAIRYGLNGAAFGFMIVGLSSIFALIVASRYIKINYFQAVIRPAILAVLMAAVVFILKGFLVTSFISVIIMCLVGGIVYGALILIFEPSILVLTKNLKSSSTQQ